MVTRHQVEPGRGFTLIELMMVISLIVILLAMALPMYSRSITRAKESTLRQDLFTMRAMIREFTLDKQRGPQSLDDLVQAGYLKQIPNDPFTGQPNWTVEEGEFLLSIEQKEPGISDVHSSSNLTAINGTAYSSW